MIARRTKKNKKLSFIKLSLLLIFLPVNVFSLVWLGTAVPKLEYKISHLQKQRDEVLREKKLLSAERASVYSMKNIEKIAMRDLGMNLPDREKVFLVKRVQGAGSYGASMKSGNSERRALQGDEFTRRAHSP
ncbi:MAG: cell division protein FtsL [Nitrospirae bacterium]|nr:cell division protein FtsL [Nitrospirota bacterium]